MGPAMFLTGASTAWLGEGSLWSKLASATASNRLANTSNTPAPSVRKRRSASWNDDGFLSAARSLRAIVGSWQWARGGASFDSPAPRAAQDEVQFLAPNQIGPHPEPARERRVEGRVTVVQ